MKKYLIILLLLIPFIFAASIQDMHKAVIARKNAGGGESEDFTTFTVVETGAEDITVDSATQVTFDSVQRGETNYIYKSGYSLTGDFEIQFDLNISDHEGNIDLLVAVCENQDDPGSCDGRAGFNYYGDGGTSTTYTIRARCLATSDTSAATFNEGTTYYVTITKDDDGGTGNGSIDVDVYSDATRETLIENMSANCGSGTDQTYIMIGTGTTTGTNWYSGVVSNLELISP